MFKFGNIEAPPGVQTYGGQDPSGLIALLNNVLKIAVVVGGLFTLVNLIISGIQYIGSSGEPKLIQQASSRIWISLLGLVVIVGSIALAALIGQIFFGNSSAIISPTIPQAPGL
jgi:hypothetical protein